MFAPPTAIYTHVPGLRQKMDSLNTYQGPFQCLMELLNVLDGVWGMVMVFNTTFNNILVISWQSVLLVEENGVL